MNAKPVRLGDSAFSGAAWEPTYPERDFEMYLRLHREGKFPLDQLVTDRYGLDQINEACDDLASGKILGRGILEY